MTVSARNQLQGTISALAEGAVNDEVELTLSGGEKLVAVVTCSSRDAMGLAQGKEAIALIKAPWVMLASETCGLRFSARNQFPCEVMALQHGAVNTTVELKSDSGLTLVSIVTNESADSMDLRAGSRVIALVKASSVLLAVRQ
ncbi:transporter [Edwardsiella ictaluri]|uniref:Molybdenum-pterin binding protein, putative n=2 Tax=Edwardsiella ictaluri TaxID=67780 RepID=C5BBK3_EDWI9|nr:TOBE domain-containing protein [Edwardsiella ictaluri]ACR68234.1 molybdenum-pterin binding protein, putative [Edwardsiella ictaluri 93-146]ARD40605.1 transporter [Edwardsiella ictaluri]AVZ81392.1 transporter [Edwardsiella ictaluri]EKS7762626.1 TOBE domain-containing protein [Edwardsiella ictaluri]EKS7769328.1 TOBE domain-containing protein [Edwardsiella ictaluri]